MGAALLLSTALAIASADQTAESRWLEATGENLARFLPDATPAGLTPEQYIFKGAADDSPDKYIRVLAHRSRQFDDAELSRHLEETDRQEKSLNQEVADSNS